jgi:hypothetical protein
MSHVFTPAKAQLLSGMLDLDTHDMRVALVMTDSTAATNRNAATLSALTLDEYNGTGYVRKALAGEIATADTTNARGKFDADDFTWASLGAATKQAIGMLLYRHVDGTAANDVPVGYINTGGFPFNGNGGNVAVTWNPEGILQLT